MSHIYNNIIHLIYAFTSILPFKSFLCHLFLMLRHLVLTLGSLFLLNPLLMRFLLLFSHAIEADSARLLEFKFVFTIFFANFFSRFRS